MATQELNGDILIKARRNQLIVEERLPINVSRSQRIQKQEEVENRWYSATDNDDRNGFLSQRNLADPTGAAISSSICNRRCWCSGAIDGQTNSYIARQRGAAAS